MSFDLPDIRKPVYDVEATIAAVEDVFERYRYFKFVEFEEIEARVTAAYEDRPPGPTNVTSDSTANIAIRNVDEKEMRKLFIEKVDRAVKRLPPDQRKLVESKYMQDELVSNFQTYTMDLGISEKFFQKLRWKAFEKLAGMLKVGVEKL